MIVYPNAKINIGLNVVEKRPDGYHNLETVFYPIGLQDILEIQEIETDAPACGYRLKVTGTVLDGSPEDNLVVRALKLLKKDFDLPPVSIGLYKHIPTGAGLGGGSADGAFTVNAPSAEPPPKPAPVGMCLYNPMLTGGKSKSFFSNFNALTTRLSSGEPSNTVPVTFSL